MIRKADLTLGWLLVIGGLLHAYGSIKAYDAMSPTLVWALSGSLAALLLAAINIMRANRPHDRTLASVAFVGSLAWLALAIDFGLSIGHVLDVRVVWHAICAVGLAGFSLRTLAGRPTLGQ
jgi:hypothetical protein